MRICAQTTVPLEFYILQHFTNYLHHSTDIVRVLSHHKGTGGRAPTPQPSLTTFLTFYIHLPIIRVCTFYTYRIVKYSLKIKDALLYS